MISIGVFLPLASIPVYGDITYHRINDSSSYVVIACVLLAPLVMILNRRKLTLLCCLGVWLTLLYPAITNTLAQNENDGFIDNLMNKAKDPLQDFAIDLFLNITELMWGGYIFVIGLIIFTLSSLIILFESN